MNYDLEKVKQLARRHLLKSHLKIHDNLLLANKLFIANHALNWVFNITKDARVIKKYVVDLEKYLRGDIELNWLNDLLLKKESLNIHDNEKTKSQESITSGSR